MWIASVNVSVLPYKEPGADPEIYFGGGGQVEQNNFSNNAYIHIYIYIYINYAA